MTPGAVIGRVLALAVAILLIVGALAIRDRDPAAPNDGPTDPPTAAPQPGVVRCARELGICRDLAARLGGDVEVMVEDGVAAARSLADVQRADVWVTLSSLVDVVEDERSRKSRGRLFAADPDPVAASPLVLVGRADRMTTLADTCGSVSWQCLGDVAGVEWTDFGGDSRWGTGKPGLADPSRSGVGLLVIGQAMASRLGGDTPSPRSFEDLAVATWFSTLARSAVISPRPFEEMLLRQGTIDVVGTTEAEVAALLRRAPTTPFDILVAASSPPVEAVAVIAMPPGASTPRGLEEAVADLLSDAGWRLPGRAPRVPLPTPLPDADGSPPALTGGALEAVRLRWEQSR